MSLFGCIGLVAALKRYKTAKSNYDQAVKDVEAKKEALLNTIEQQQQYSNYEKEADRYAALEYYNRNIEDVLVDKPAPHIKIHSFLMIGWDKLGKKFYRVKPILRILNQGYDVLHIVKSPIYIDNFGCVMSFNFAGTDVQDEAVIAALEPLELTLHRGEYIDLVIPTGNPIGELLRNEADGFDISSFGLKNFILKLITPIIEYYTKGAYPKTHAMRMAVTQFKEDYDCGIAKIPMNAVMDDRMYASASFYYYTTEDERYKDKGLSDADPNIKLAIYKDIPGRIIWKGQNKYDEMSYGISENEVLKW